MIHQKRRPFLVLASAALTLSALSWSPMSMAQATDTIKFGMSMPLSGTQALFGADQVKAAQMGVADINAKGGVNGKPLEMILIDTQADPQLGINAAKRFVSVDKLPIFLTSWSAVVKAVAPIANREKYWS